MKRVFGTRNTIFRVIEVLTKVLVAALILMLVVYILLVLLEGFITGGGPGPDVALNLAAEAIAFTLSILVVNAVTDYIAKKKEKRRQMPLECAIHARLLKIIRDLIVNILPQEAYQEDNSMYESIYGDRVTPGFTLKCESQGRLFSIEREYLEHKHTAGEKFDTAPLDYAREQTGNILNRSFSFLHPELVSLLIRLEFYLERSIELLGAMKSEDWENNLSRQQAAYSLSLVASETVKIRKWLDRVLNRQFKVARQGTDQSESHEANP